MQWEPKVGMKVRCIHNRDYDDNQLWPLTVGKVYEVLKVGETYLDVWTDKGSKVSYVHGRFEPVEETADDRIDALMSRQKPIAVDPYATLGAEIGRLVTEKQKAYGQSFQKSGEIIRILFPDGVPVSKYDDMLTITRMLDKIFRVCNDKNAFGESAYRDLAGYALLAAVRDEKK